MIHRRASMVLAIFMAIALYGNLNAQDRWTFLDEGVEYLWPTNASNYMSATFAETRAAHFHAAIDIGTWGREGYDVYAARDGIVYRVGISPHGYGNVIYLRHNDGSFTVYAHLQDFHPIIRAVVDSLRFEDYRHSFDERFENFGISFNRGDFIGRTGSTGIGPPHLHFEIRSPDHTVINPKLAGVHINDSVPPVFSSIAVEPLSADASIGGSKNIAVRRPTVRGNHYDFGTIEVAGITGLAVNVYDQADFARNVYAVYELKLEVNGELFFHSKADSFHFDVGRQMLIDRSFPLLQQRRGGFQRLYISGGNTLPFYKETGRSGKLNLEPGTHEYRIIARDFYGNQSTASGRIRVSPSEPLIPSEIHLFAVKQHEPLFLRQTSRANPAAAFTWRNRWFSPTTETLRNVKIRQDGGFLVHYPTIGPNEGIELFGNVVEVSGDGFRAFRAYRVAPNRGTAITSQNKKVNVVFREESMFDTTWVNVQQFYHNGRFRVAIGPADKPVNRSYEIQIRLPEHLRDNPKIGLYHVNSTRNVYDYMHGTLSDSVLTVRVNRFGVFEIRQDTTPPGVNRPTIYRRSSDGQWFASVRAFDLETGLDFNKVVFVINGVRGIPEYDPFGNVIRYHHPEFRPVRGENVLELRVPDRAGNVTETRFTVRH